MSCTRTPLSPDRLPPPPNQSDASSRQSIASRSPLEIPEAGGLKLPGQPARSRNPGLPLERRSPSAFLSIHCQRLDEHSCQPLSGARRPWTNHLVDETRVPYWSPKYLLLARRSFIGCGEVCKQLTSIVGAREAQLLASTGLPILIWSLRSPVAVDWTNPHTTHTLHISPTALYLRVWKKVSHHRLQLTAPPLLISSSPHLLIFDI